MPASSPNASRGHFRFCLRATGRKDSPWKSQPRPRRNSSWMPAEYHADSTHLQYWFGLSAPEDGSGNINHANDDLTKGLLQPYEKNIAIGRCPSWTGTAKFGPGNGYGYNWGYIGGQLYQPNTPGYYFAAYPDAGAPAFDNQIIEASNTITFADAGDYTPTATSVGKLVEAPFIDPPSQWDGGGGFYGTPSVNFRHVDQTAALDIANSVVVEKGFANLLFCDGHVKAYNEGQVLSQGDKLFELTKTQ